MNNGWIKLHRKLLDSEIWDKPSDWLKVWIYLMLEVDRNTGELKTSYAKIALDCKVAEGIVKRVLERARQCADIETIRVRHGVVVLVLNYAQYQESQKTQKADTRRTESRQRADKEPNVYKQEVRSKKEEEEYNTTNVVLEPEAQYGNEKINKMLEALKAKVGVDDFADSQRWKRIYGKHCLNLLEKIGRSEFSRRLDLILKDDFKRKNCNKIRYIYEQVKGFIEPQEGAKFAVIS
jgi:hypothetical protein